MLSVKQLLATTRATHPQIIANAKTVRVRFDAVVEREDDDGDVYREVRAICRGASIPREVTLKLYGKGSDALAWVSCTCEWFLYHCEVALWTKFSSDIIHSNGQNPSITNPRRIGIACKHIARCFMDGAASLAPTRKAGKEKATKPDKSAQKRMSDSKQTKDTGKPSKPSPFQVKKR